VIIPCLHFCAATRNFVKWTSISDYLITHKIESEVTDTQVTAGYYQNNNTVIAFRSTELKFKDFFTDLLFFQTEIPYLTMSRQSPIRVHTGFVRAYHSVRPYLLNSVPDVKVNQG